MCLNLELSTFTTWCEPLAVVYTFACVLLWFVSSNVPIVDISYSEDTSLWEDEEKNYSYLTKVETNDGTITAICLKDRPENNFSIKLKISGDLTSENTVSKDDFNSTIGDINNILESITGAVE